MNGFRVISALMVLMVLTATQDFRMGTNERDGAFATVGSAAPAPGNGYGCVEHVSLAAAGEINHPALGMNTPRSLNVFPAISSIAAMVYSAMEEGGS